MEANDPRCVANLDPRGIIGRIYEGYHLKLIHTKYIGFRPCGFRGEDVFYFSHYKLMLDNDAPGAWPIWARGTQLAGFMKRVIKH